MRSTMPSAIAAVTVLALLGGLGSVTAQGDEASITYSVGSGGHDVEIVSQGTTTYTEGGVRQLRGLEATGVSVHEDPRLNVTAHVVYNEDEYPDWMGPKWAHVEAEGEDGSWVGWSLGIEVPREEGAGRFPVYIRMAAGRGGYEGLSQICYETYPDGPGWDSVDECIIFEGSLPDLSIPSAD